MIYVSSKIKYAPMWRQLREEGRNIISSWIDKPTENVTKKEFSSLWAESIKECCWCKFLILYREPEDNPLKAAIVEMGAALAHGAKIIIVGDIPEVGTAYLHPNVILAKNLDEAFYIIDFAEVIDEGETGADWRCEVCNTNWYNCLYSHED